uniref:Uncharacterized protein n=1 Tax=Cacopsylla melanoneura TaxID=428564 RepID=A0A8D8UFI4_9HEMI
MSSCSAVVCRDLVRLSISLRSFLMAAKPCTMLVRLVSTVALDTEPSLFFTISPLALRIFVMDLSNSLKLLIRRWLTSTLVLFTYRSTSCSPVLSSRARL